MRIRGIANDEVVMRAAIDTVDPNFKIVLSVDSPGVYGNTSAPTDDMVQVRIRDFNNILLIIDI